MKSFARSGVLGLVCAFIAAPAYAADVSTGPCGFCVLWDWIPFILNGFALNVVISILAMMLALVLGIGLGLMQISESKLASVPARFVTQLLRNAPWIVILFMIMSLIPYRIEVQGWGNFILSDWIKATFAFSLPVMANVSEILRGAVASVPKGQWESAESLAFSRGQSLRWIILPQCVKQMIPHLMNWFALLVLATPLASIIGVREAVGSAQAAMESAGSSPTLLIPFYFFLMMIFFIFIYPVAIWSRRLERNYAINS
ncbi:amino acid ABC transporter permease [Alloyangia pacifica]|uniref:Amino acid ABC transporter membrane protein 2, PAAT family n=1 Tax=Alloyangia pacifica TaxID=311180 RepID=A0A1I6UX36_9RHOB|nr:amino acid ABC transporter permease [Alloyangia pacifica]SDI29202.1 amino acid ABC transporter membrane protein 2, PAAT family [Alloyangia pacifica]SFT05988.1 amino acid ABC transporter membrane protein 2, PAAT family [Alloyangia pacifica]